MLKTSWFHYFAHWYAMNAAIIISAKWSQSTGGPRLQPWESCYFCRLKSVTLMLRAGDTHEASIELILSLALSLRSVTISQHRKTHKHTNTQTHSNPSRWWQKSSVYKSVRFTTALWLHFYKQYYWWIHISNWWEFIVRNLFAGCTAHFRAELPKVWAQTLFCFLPMCSSTIKAKVSVFNSTRLELPTVATSEFALHVYLRVLFHSRKRCL